jgi:hypothetical protein
MQIFIHQLKSSFDTVIPQLATPKQTKFLAGFISLPGILLCQTFYEN